MKETDIWELLVSLSGNEISLAEAHNKILRLSIVGHSTVTIVQEQNTDELLDVINGFAHFTRGDTILKGEKDYTVCGCTYLADEQRLLVQCEEN